MPKSETPNAAKIKRVEYKLSTVFMIEREYWAMVFITIRRADSIVIETISIL